MPKVFLDKLVTSAHMPRAEGSRGYISKTTFPDLSHTMISTQFCAPKPNALTSKGEVLQTYKHHAFVKYQKTERPNAELKHKPKFFKRAHNVFANRVLMDLEAMKRTRNERRDQIWKKGKAETGFNDLEAKSTIASVKEFDQRSHNRRQGGGPEDPRAQQRPATTQGQSSSSFNNSDFFNKSTGSLLQPKGYINDGGKEIEDDYGGDFFEIGADFDPNAAVETTLPTGLDDYANDDFEMATPVLAATVPADFGRPSTSAAAASGHTVRGGDGIATGSSESFMKSTGSDRKNPVQESDTRVGMNKRLTGDVNPLIAAEEAKFQPTSRSMADLAFSIVGRGSAEKVASPAKTPNNDSINIVKSTDSSASQKRSLCVQISEDVNVLEATQRSPGVASVRSTGSASNSRRRPKTKDGLPPPRMRKGFSRQTYFECLMDSLDVPVPHAPRFGMVTSPHKEKQEKQTQRRAQTAGFAGTYDSPINVPSTHVDFGPIEQFDPDPDAGGSELFAALDGEMESNLAIEDGKADTTEYQRPLSKGSMKGILTRLAISRGGGARARTAAAAVITNTHMSAPTSPIHTHRLVPTEKWHTTSIEHALSGTEMGSRKPKVYR
jgi:hypothetical protein